MENGIKNIFLYKSKFVKNHYVRFWRIAIDMQFFLQG